MEQHLYFDTCGDPREVLRLAPLPALAEPQEGEVVLRPLLSPINPSDLNYIEGTYGVRPVLPATAGLEGVARVEAVGYKVDSVTVGQLVFCPRDQGVWRTCIICPAASLQHVPAGLSIERAAMAQVNPPTAWALLHEFVELRRGEVIIQNAANSATGRLVSALARRNDWRCINVVRSEEARRTLLEAGEQIVLLDEEVTAESIGSQRPRLALNAVGGESALRLAKVLEEGGSHITYGGMSRQPFRAPTGLLIFRDIRFLGFWRNRWVERVVPERLARMWQEVTELLNDPRLSLPVAGSYALGDYRQAIAHALSPDRRGKVLLRLQGDLAIG